MAHQIKVLEAVLYFPDGTTKKLTGEHVGAHDPNGPAVWEILDPRNPDRQRIYVGLPYTVLYESTELALPHRRGGIILPGTSENG